MKAGRFLASLYMLGLLANAAYGAEPSAALKQYTFELQTFNAADKIRRGRAPFSGAPIEFSIGSAMTDEELESVKRILDQLGASPPDEQGYRSFSMSNGTRGRIGGFVEDPEVAGSGVQSLPVTFAVEKEFSTEEAALVLRIAAAGNLFVVSPVDPDLAATAAPVTERRFRRAHKQAAVTPDENALAEWIRQNIRAD
jgi:hypothetical protein